MGQRFPLGTARESDIGSFDFTLEGLRSDIRRSRDPSEPPEEKEADALVVPRALFDQAMSAEIMRKANAMGIQQDANSLSFNARLQGAREIASAPFEQSRSEGRFELPLPTPPRHPAYEQPDLIEWIDRLRVVGVVATRAIKDMGFDPNDI